MTDVYKDTENKIAISLNEENKYLFIYDCNNGAVLKETEGILKELDSDLFKETENFFNINLLDYGVVKCDESQTVE